MDTGAKEVGTPPSPIWLIQVSCRNQSPTPRPERRKGAVSPDKKTGELRIARLRVSARAPIYARYAVRGTRRAISRMAVRIDANETHFGQTDRYTCFTWLTCPRRGTTGHA